MQYQDGSNRIFKRLTGYNSFQDRRNNMAKEERNLMSREAQERLIEGARKGGKAEKHFSQESKERQREGARKGGQHSHMNDPGRNT
jgi:general stress protein YciG